MDEKNIKRKEWVKTAAIIFLSVMLILTLFSGTIMNYSLPEIATEYIRPESITSQVRGTGTVEALDPYSVIIEENRVIKSVVYTNGDFVEKGQILFYLEDSKSPEIDALEKQIEDAEFAYKQALLGENVSNSVYSNVENGVETDTDTYQNRIQQQKQQVQNIKNTLNGLQNEKTTLEAKQFQLGAAGMDLGTATTNAENAKVNQTAKQNDYNTAKNAYNAAKAAYDTAKAELDNHVATCVDCVAGNPCTAVPSKGELETALSTAQATMTPLKAPMDNAKTALDAATNDVFEADSIVAVIQQLNQVNANIVTATSNLSIAEANLSQMLNDVQMEISLSAQKQNIDDMKAELVKLQEKSVGGTVVAPITGKVTGISHVAGESFSAGETVAVMQPEGKGHTLSFSVSNRQASALSIGDKGSVSNSWYYTDVIATLMSIKPDPADPTNSKKLTFNLEGDVTAGQTLTLSVGERSSNFDYTVPNTAIREDKDGKFILVLEQKPSPLGNRYFAVRRDIEVIASDDRRTAIRGNEIYAYDYVVTTSTKPIEEGQQVRLKDE